MLTHGFEQMLSEPTRSCSGTCIDHVFLRSFTDKYTCSCGTIDLNVSDHKLVTILLSGPSDLTPKPREDAQDTIRKINFDHLRRNLLEEGWVGVYTATNSSVMFQSFIDRLRTLVDKNTRVVSFSPIRVDAFIGVLISTIPVRRSGGWLVFASLKSLSTHGYCRLHGVRILWVMLGRGWCDMVALEDWMRTMLVGCRVKQSVLVDSSRLGGGGSGGDGT
ncbi:hypothetical protein DMENIID0001_137290 [Sergentomyia squamirostris]